MKYNLSPLRPRSANCSMFLLSPQAKNKLCIFKGCKEKQKIIHSKDQQSPQTLNYLLSVPLQNKFVKSCSGSVLSLVRETSEYYGKSFIKNKNILMREYQVTNLDGKSGEKIKEGFTEEFVFKLRHIDLQSRQDHFSLRRKRGMHKFKKHGQNKRKVYSRN